MRGFLVAALVLIGLDVALSAPASRLTSLFALPAGLLAEWMDPGKPLIAVGHLADSSASSGSSSSGSGAGAANLAGAIGGALVSPITGGIVP